MNFSQISTLPKIKDVELNETIGNGAFACVKTAYLKADPSVIFAVKFVHIPTCTQQGLTEKDITKEVVLQSKCSDHPNVLKIIDCNISTDFMWIIMELAEGGDLFDKIEPDVGVDSSVAQFYFQQLVNAVVYLHTECGVSHRDIKPENILLDNNGNLKLADFGLASQFKRKDGSLRISTDQKGSPPYMAPEVLHSSQYFADKTDIWSIGVLLFVLLTGEIPWEAPLLEDSNFQYFIEHNGNITLGPWSKIDLNQLNLLRKILQPNPDNRISLEMIKKHPWFTTKVPFAGSDGLCNDPSQLAKRLYLNLKVSLSDDDYLRSTQDPGSYGRSNAGFRATQPVGDDYADIEHDPLATDHNMSTQLAFTQYNHNRITDKYAHNEQNWTQLLSNDLALLQFSDKSLDGSLSTNLRFDHTKLTKFYSLANMEEIISTLEEALRFSNIKVKPNLYDNFLKLSSSMGAASVFPVTINIKTDDFTGLLLSGVISINKVQEDLKIISINRKSGDPLEWRRLFKKLALLCRNLVFIPN
ncbi:hypothetical protein TPHA_0O01400 [Tetrapisispora phaffii CBS 4417]|uniref:non-specific serine/threonine protein kinase n=1 Tax=Tetrapisispora phaffii (strain ATCC 24235 / CBS 4417 / NBRC 1672 / NRRL Y-8282 / UCD 70-5) TaxID=1071381 RepID=G8C1S9_TETPH|nr:hypothetical protein TPHA_0O01400 [Tetrapisispora phaffii CBS 4417]CCE66107.1 hypothetical protein TPHA_0O01400 [Tetrapisispora phaffii CBS 4417]